MFRAVADIPLAVAAAFHELTIDWLPDQVHVTFQVFVAVVPVLLTVTVATKPSFHWLSTMLAEHLAVPELAAVAVGVGVGIAVGKAVYRAVGVALAVRVGVGVALPPVALNEKEFVLRP
jgi:ABC-type polysaccharide/polyol phosphate export permease